MEMPKTKMQLLAYLNTLLTDLVQEARGESERSACITFHIDGNHTVIQECIENRLEEYNTWHEKFNWQYSVQNDGSNDYTLYVSQIELEPTFDAVDDDETSLAEKDELDECPHCNEKKHAVEFKNCINGDDVMVCEDCNNTLAENDEDDADSC